MSNQDIEAHGPWRMLLKVAKQGSEEELCECRRAMSMLIQHVHLFAPNELLCALDIELVDYSIESDASSPKRLLAQRQREAEEVDSLIVMSGMTMLQKPMREYLEDSPFVARLIDAHLHPHPNTPPPLLSFMVYR
jgi:hypothetical protein